jgi:Fur family ferric uptake transcriptional regulator/Fur family zinc uptake transcriptional regulator
MQLYCDYSTKGDGALTAAEEVLREKELRSTPIRRRVLDLLLRLQIPLSQQEISTALTVGKQVPDRVTLYRTLLTFSKAHVVNEIREADGIVRFVLCDPCRGGCLGSHPHFLCRKCGCMFCLPGQPLPHVEVPTGTVLEGKQLLVFGLCPRCAH